MRVALTRSVRLFSTWGCWFLNLSVVLSPGNWLLSLLSMKFVSFFFHFGVELIYLSFQSWYRHRSSCALLEYVIALSSIRSIREYCCFFAQFVNFSFQCDCCCLSIESSTSSWLKYRLYLTKFYILSSERHHHCRSESVYFIGLLPHNLATMDAIDLFEDSFLQRRLLNINIIMNVSEVRFIITSVFRYYSFQCSIFKKSSIFDFLKESM